MSTETPDPQPPRRRRWWDVALPAAGILAVAVGVGVLVWRAAHPVAFGWTAYAPLSSTVYWPDAGRSYAWAFSAIALGAVVLAFWAGLGVGRRSR